MGLSVFPDGVVGGLKRWRAKARRKVAERNNRSLDASVNASVESSPSFATLETSLSVDLDYSSDDDVDWANEENARVRQPQKSESFQGFEMNRV